MNDIASDTREKPFVAPSGRTYTPEAINLLLMLEKIGSFVFREKPKIPLNSGGKSHFYVRLRSELGDNPLVLLALARLIKNEIERIEPPESYQWCVIGIPTPGTQIAQAVSMLSACEYMGYQQFFNKKPIAFRTMRTRKKTHGLKDDQRLMVSADNEKHSYVTIENALNQGTGYYESLMELRNEGYPISNMRHIAFVDWERGGVATLSSIGARVHALYTLRDIVAVLVHYGRWPANRIEILQQETKRQSTRA